MRLSTGLKRRARLVVTVAGALTLLVGCTDSHPPGDESAARSTVSTDLPGEVVSGDLQRPGFDEWCAGRRDSPECLTLENGRQAVVVRSTASRPVKQLVFWDPGGPGLGLPDADTVLSMIVPRSLRRFDVVFLVEPWVDHAPSAACLTAAAGDGGNVGAACELDRLYSGDDLGPSVAAIQDGAREPVVGAYLQSFGATRAESLLRAAPGNGLHWVVLESPSPRAGTSADAFMVARRTAVLAAVGATCDTDACRRRLRQQLIRWAEDGVALRASGRDVALGVTSMVGDAAQNGPALARLRAGLRKGTMSRRVGAELRRLAQSYALRTSDQAEPQLVALWADTCPRFTDWDRLSRRRDPFLKAYAWVFDGCRGSTLRAARRLSVAVPMTVLTGRQDVIVPAALQQPWIDAAPASTQLFGQGHFWDSSQVTREVERWILDQPPAQHDRSQ